MNLLKSFLATNIRIWGVKKASSLCHNSSSLTFHPIAFKDQFVHHQTRDLPGYQNSNHWVPCPSHVQDVKFPTTQVDFHFHYGTEIFVFRTTWVSSQRIVLPSVVIQPLQSSCLCLRPVLASPGEKKPILAKIFISLLSSSPLWLTYLFLLIVSNNYASSSRIWSI